jgi:integrase
LLDEIVKMQHPFRSRTYRALLLILYCTGLRTGEAVRLRIRDVDLRENALRVEVSKAKSRWVPFEETLARELSNYLRERRLISPVYEDSPFLVQPNGSPCGRPIVSNRITALLRQTGIKPRRGRVGPRPYDTAIASQSIGSPSGTVRASTCRSVSRGCPRTLVTMTCLVHRTTFS